jgi:preprotein translocase subunit SecA
MPANPRGWRDHVSRLQGSTVHLDLSPYEAPLAAIEQLDAASRELSDEEILRASQGLHDRARAGQPLVGLRAPSSRWRARPPPRARQRPFDEQVVAALALDDGRVEMQTGEGKTLAAVMPAALNALTDRGVHVLTFNDYLARRDAGWMGPVYQALGLSVGYVEEGMPPAARRAAYNADITYVTAKEAGFDHLRDLLAMDARDLAHRPFNFALVDEADSLMIDEARARS